MRQGGEGPGHETLTNVRARLYYEVRRLHLEDVPDVEAMGCIRDIVDMIWARVDLSDRP